jgi:DNA repair photolyase
LPLYEALNGCSNAGVKPVSNPPNPWLSTHVEYLEEPPPDAALEVFEEEAKSILSENDSPDLGFRWSVNPYRGCFHSCAYCYARPSHQYLGYGAGTDFDRKIVVKTNAAPLLRAAFMKPNWQGDLIMFSGITDCYQPMEASYGITRACLEVCAEFANPIGVITKSIVVRRDADLLARLAKEARASVTLSIPFARDDLAKKIEPFASPPSRRFETLKILADAGVRTGIAIAPVIPGLTDQDIPELLERARAAGATSAFMTMLRLPAEVLPVFRERIRETLPPERVRKIEHAVVELRGGTGKMNEATFGARFVGVGERWKVIEALFDLHYRRLGFGRDDDDAPDPPTTFRRPPVLKPQLDLF